MSSWNLSSSPSLASSFTCSSRIPEHGYFFIKKFQKSITIDKATDTQKETLKRDSYFWCYHRPWAGTWRGPCWAAPWPHSGTGWRLSCRRPATLGCGPSQSRGFSGRSDRTRALRTAWGWRWGWRRGPRSSSCPRGTGRCRPRTPGVNEQWLPILLHRFTGRNYWALTSALVSRTIEFSMMAKHLLRNSTRKSANWADCKLKEGVKCTVPVPSLCFSDGVDGGGRREKKRNREERGGGCVGAAESGGSGSESICRF